MAKQDNLETFGIIDEAVGNSNFKVTLDNGAKVFCTISGKMRKFYIKITVGDRVKVNLSVYDLTHGIITERIDPKKPEISEDIRKKKKKKGK